MNNKGFAITSIIYGLMLLFIMIITSFLSMLVGRNRRIDELLESVYDNVSYEKIVVNTTDFNTESTGVKAYITEKRALYEFDINGIECTSYLPNNTLLVTGDVMSDSSDSLYYSVGGGVELSNYSKVQCINE